MTTIAGQTSIENRLSQSEKRKIIFIMCTVLLFSVMNGTMFMIAVPDIAYSFSLVPSQVSWVVTSYIVVYAIGALMYGKLADIYPLKTLLTIGLSLFGVGSILGFFSPSFLMVIVARIVQAAGASSILALVFIVPSRYFPQERGKVLGIISSTMAFASGIGPVIGGFVAGILHWNFLFLISACVLLSIPFFWMWIPKEEKKAGKVDLLGAFLVAIAVASIILFITLLVWWYLIISIGFFVLFVLRIFKYDNPFIRPDLFRSVSYRTTIITSFFAMMTMMGNMFLLPLMLSDVNGLNTLAIGLTIFPAAMAAALTGKWAGVLTEKWGGKQVVYLAFAFMISGFGLLSTLVGQNTWVIALVTLLVFIAFPFIQTSTANLLSEALPKSEIGVGMGIYNLFNFMAGALGGALIGKALDYKTDFLINPFSIAEGNETMYSNVFISLAILTIANCLFFRLVMKK
ncbi:MFS transporter [Bacillus suaedae]|uniref:Tetracycline resistance protein n=1 Tax=Halalkalibacter suaedae TaxID=2822140 RepID=A0A941APK5_9BACI|nr:MFS transporter [Bacillus suaedae]MBP3952885.1 MFS transporter [Bacillus suaedae]